MSTETEDTKIETDVTNEDGAHTRNGVGLAQRREFLTAASIAFGSRNPEASPEDAWEFAEVLYRRGKARGYLA